MLKSITIAAALASLAAGVFGHGVMTIPTPRKTGARQLALCGSPVTKKLESDKAGPIENAMAKADSTYNCNAYLCRGYQYEDNTSNVKAVKAGDVIPIHIDLVAGHQPGWANVSVVDFTTNKVIGDALKPFKEWPISGSNEDIDFNITIPASLGSTCASAGKCVVQWYWWSNSNSQTYESCFDFYVQ